jgi:hypothetical protein
MIIDQLHQHTTISMLLTVYVRMCLPHNAALPEVRWDEFLGSEEARRSLLESVRTCALLQYHSTGVYVICLPHALAAAGGACCRDPGC